MVQEEFEEEGGSGIRWPAGIQPTRSIDQQLEGGKRERETYAFG